MQLLVPKHPHRVLGGSVATLLATPLTLSTNTQESTSCPVSTASHYTLETSTGLISRIFAITIDVPGTKLRRVSRAYRRRAPSGHQTGFQRILLSSRVAACTCWMDDSTAN